MTTDLEDRLRRYGQTFEQAVLAGGDPEATGSTVLVHRRPNARRLVPIAAVVIAALAAWFVASGPDGRTTVSSGGTTPVCQTAGPARVCLPLRGGKLTITGTAPGSDVDIRILAPESEQSIDVRPEHSDDRGRLTGNGISLSPAGAIVTITLTPAGARTPTTLVLGRPAIVCKAGEHFNTVVHFKPGTFTVPAGLTGQAAVDAPQEAIERVAAPLRVLDFHVQDTMFAPDPGAPKGQLAAFVAFTTDATADDVAGFIDNAARQPAFQRLEWPTCS